MIEFSGQPELLPVSNARTLGSAAIDAAYASANRGLDLDFANEDLLMANRLVSAGVTDPRFAGKLNTFARRVFKKEYSSPDDQACIRQWLEKNNIIHLSRAPARLNTLIRGMEWDYDESQEEQKLAITKVRKELRAYSPVHQNQLDELWNSGELYVPDLFRRAKQAYEEEVGRDIQWVEWIATYADEQTLLHILEWGLHKVDQETSASEFTAKVERVKQGYAKGLYAAHEDGLLDDLDGALARLDQIRIAAFHPLSQVRANANTRGLAHREDDYVEVRNTSAEFDAYHELSHVIFDTVSPLLEEGTVEMIAGYLYEKATKMDKPATAYDQHDVLATKELLTLAGITEREWISRVMDSKKSAIEKLMGFADAISNKTGYDALMYLEITFSRMREKYFDKFGAASQAAGRRLAFDDARLFKKIFEAYDEKVAPKILAEKVLQSYKVGHFTEDEVMKVLYLIYKHQDLSTQ